MAKCPRCGAEVVDPVKSWSMIGKPDRSGEMFKLTIGLYNCVCSDRSFRSVIGKEKITLRGVLEKNNSLEEQLMEATSKKSELECVVKALEEEKTQLLAEVEALRAIPVLEEKVSTLESDIARLREEKGTLMSRLTKLASGTELIVQPETVEKPLEAYISEAANTEAPAPIEESTCECNEAETQGTETVTESPVIDAVATEAPAPVDQPIETSIEEKPLEVSPVEAIPTPVVPEVVPAAAEASTETPLSDALTVEKIIETPAENVATDIQPVTTSPEDVAPTIVEAPPIETPSIDNQQVEIPATENPIVTEAAEEVSPETIQVDVSSSQPQVIAPMIEEKAIDAPVIESNEVPVEANPETPLTAIAPVETVTEVVDQTEEVQSEPLVTETLTEVKAVDVVLAETVSAEEPTPVEDNSVEIPLPAVTPLDDPSINEKVIEYNPAEDVSSSVETLDAVISEMAKEIEGEKPVEAVSESTSPNISELVQVLPIEAAQTESPTQESNKAAETQAVESGVMEVPKIEAPVVETVIAENPKVEELITETLSADNQASVTNSVEIVTDVNVGEASKPSEEKKTELIIA